jgi:hypothetical protein
LQVASTLKAGGLNLAPNAGAKTWKPRARKAVTTPKEEAPVDEMMRVMDEKAQMSRALQTGNDQR